METARVLKIIIEIDGNIVYEGESFMEGLATTLPSKITSPKDVSIYQKNVKKKKH